MYRHTSLFVLLTALASCCEVASGEVIITFSSAGTNPDNGVALNGHVQGSSTSFVDSATSVTSTLTTGQVIGADGTSGASLRVEAGALGVNSSENAQDDRSFNGSEEWSFTWNTSSDWQGIAFGEMTGNDSFRVQSSSWQGLTITDAHRDVTFDSSSGSFLLRNRNSVDSFTLGDLVGSSGATLTVDAGTTIAIRYFGQNANSSATIESLTFGLGTAAIPEPTHFALIGLGIGGVLVAKRKRQQSGS